MKWLQVSARVTAEEVEAVAEVFHRFGQGGVALEEEVAATDEDYRPHPLAPVTVKTYLPFNKTLPRKRRQIERALSLLSLINPLAPISYQAIDEEDWAHAWKAHFHSHKVVHRLAIKPPWQDYLPQEGEVIIELDPGQAFGTGLHPTTQMCLVELEQRLKPGMAVLDLGTGSGILAIAAAKLRAGYVLALDKDELAVRVARANVSRNGVKKVVRVAAGSLVTSLKPQGILIASGIRRRGWPGWRSA